jgi:hypothetical protein
LSITGAGRAGREGRENISSLFFFSSRARAPFVITVGVTLPQGWMMMMKRGVAIADTPGGPQEMLIVSEAAASYPEP